MEDRIVGVGRAVSHMRFALWDYDVGFCLYTSVEEDALKDRFGIPLELAIGAIVGFIYPKGLETRTKQRRPIAEVISENRLGETFLGR